MRAMNILNLENQEKFGWMLVIVSSVVGAFMVTVHFLDSFLQIGDLEFVRINISNFFRKEFYEHFLEYRDYDKTRLSHMIPSIVVTATMPLQFSKGFRRKHPKLHRKMGLMNIILCLATIPSGLIFVFRYPFVGFLEQVPVVIFASLFVFCIGKGYVTAKKRNFLEHREWMIRSFSIIVGIYTTRLWYGVFSFTSDIPAVEILPTTFWLAVVVNLVIAEYWINVTKAVKGKI